MSYVIAFLASGAAVVIAGAALARQGEVISEASGLGRLWIGAVLLAGATSLPELVTDIAAVRLGAEDLAAGDLFGSSLANMLILALLDLLWPRKQVLRSAALDHVLGACLAISLTAFAVVLVVMKPTGSLLWTGAGSLGLFAAYLAGTRAVYRHATRGGSESTSVDPTTKQARPGSLRRAGLAFALAALVVMAAAPVFAWAATGLATITGLGNTFVGTWLVGLATSLPEIVTCVAAVRMGAFDLAVGNLFGSNAFNMAIFLPIDLAQPGNLFSALDPGHALSGAFAVVMMSLGLAAIAYRAERRFRMLEPDSLLMLAVYVGALVALYFHSARP